MTYQLINENLPTTIITVFLNKPLTKTAKTCFCEAQCICVHGKLMPNPSVVVEALLPPMILDNTEKE